MTYSDPEKRRAYQRTYYHKKLAPGGEKYEEYRIYQREYYREQLGVDGEKHEQTLERNRAYYRKQLGVGGEKHEQYIEKHRKYNNTYQKHEHYKVGKRWRDNGRYQREKLQSSLLDGTDLGWLKRRRIRNRLKQLETTLWFFRYKYTLRCQHCGMDHPGCIQFHHRDKDEKKTEVSNLRQTSIKQLQSEMNKCDVLCANCHAKLHWKERYGYNLEDL